MFFFHYFSKYVLVKEIFDRITNNEILHIESYLLFHPKSSSDDPLQVYRDTSNGLLNTQEFP